MITRDEARAIVTAKVPSVIADETIIDATIRQAALGRNRQCVVYLGYDGDVIYWCNKLADMGYRTSVDGAYIKISW